MKKSKIFKVTSSILLILLLQTR